jgi:hypothetical protein
MTDSRIVQYLIVIVELSDKGFTRVVSQDKSLKIPSLEGRLLYVSIEIDDIQEGGSPFMSTPCSIACA